MPQAYAAMIRAVAEHARGPFPWSSMSTHPFSPPRAPTAHPDASKVAGPILAWLLQRASAILVAGMARRGGEPA